MNSGTFVGGATNIYYEIYLDGLPGGVNTKHYFFASNTQEYVSLQSYFTGLSAGSHTITIIGATNAGTSSNVIVDAGGYSGRVIVKETF